MPSSFPPLASFEFDEDVGAVEEKMEVPLAPPPPAPAPKEAKKPKPPEGPKTISSVF